MARMQSHEKLWRYTSLVRMWSWALIAVGLAMYVVSTITQAGSDSGLSLRFMGIMTGVSGLTGVMFYPLLHMWLKKTAPSGYLERATRLTGKRRLEAGPADWRRWGLTMGLALFLATVALLGFLIGVLRSSGPDGIAEGVVIGVVVAWGLVTLEDGRHIERIETAEGRRYFTASNRPTAAGNKLVWLPWTTEAPDVPDPAPDPQTAPAGESPA